MPVDFKNSSVVNATVGCGFINLFLQLISIKYQKKARRILKIHRCGLQKLIRTNATVGCRFIIPFL